MRFRVRNVGVRGTNGSVASSSPLHRRIPSGPGDVIRQHACFQGKAAENRDRILMAAACLMQGIH